MLTAVVVTQNEERNIARCLRSVQFADEIIVVDAFSQDRTAGLASELGARVIKREWQGFARQKQFAIDSADTEWVLLIDADEEVSPQLVMEIKNLLAGDPNEAGFRIRRRNQFLGRWIEHGPWARDFQTRLFRKRSGSIARRPVHEGVQIDGEFGILRSPLNHYTHQTLSESVRRRYTSLEAPERVDRRRIRAVDVAVPPIGVFLRYYIFGGGWRDGFHGFLLAATTAMYRCVLYLKIYSLQRDRDAQTAG